MAAAKQSGASFVATQQSPQLIAMLGMLALVTAVCAPRVYEVYTTWTEKDAALVCAVHMLAVAGHITGAVLAATRPTPTLGIVLVLACSFAWNFPIHMLTSILRFTGYANNTAHFALMDFSNSCVLSFILLWVCKMRHPVIMVCAFMGFIEHLFGVLGTSFGVQVCRTMIVDFYPETIDAMGGPLSSVVMLYREIMLQSDVVSCGIMLGALAWAAVARLPTPGKSGDLWHFVFSLNFRGSA